MWDALLRQQIRIKAGRRVEHSVTIVDSQSLKTVSKGGSADIRVKERKHHIASDAMGLLLGAEPVWLKHAGAQTLPVAHLQVASQALDCGKNLCLAESIKKI